MPLTIMCASLREVEMEDVSGMMSDSVSMSSNGTSPPSSLLLSPASPQDQSPLLSFPAEVRLMISIISDDDSIIRSLRGILSDTV